MTKNDAHEGVLPKAIARIASRICIAHRRAQTVGATPCGRPKVCPKNNKIIIQNGHFFSQKCGVLWYNVCRFWMALNRHIQTLK